MSLSVIGGKLLHKRVGIAVLLSFALLNILLLLLNISQTFEHPLLLAGLNIVFQAGTFLVSAYIAGRSYLKSSLIQLLLIGSGMVAFGISNLTTGIVSLTVTGAEWANFNVTMHNIGLLGFSALNF